MPSPRKKLRKYEKELIGDMMHLGEQIFKLDALMALGKSKNFRVVEEDYISPTIEEEVLPINHEYGLRRYYQNLSSEIRSILRGDLSEEELRFVTDKAPIYVLEYVRLKNAR